MTKQIAELLVTAGYADEWILQGGGFPTLVKIDGISGVTYERVELFKDSLEGIHQAQALIEYFRIEYRNLWGDSSLSLVMFGLTWWEHNIERLKYCLDNVT